MASDLDELVTFLMAYESGAAWASSPEEAAAHIRDVLGYRSPSMVGRIDEALAAAEARGRREGQQWAIDALRDGDRWLAFLQANDDALYDEDNLLAAAFLADSIAKEGADGQ